MNTRKKKQKSSNAIPLPLEITGRLPLEILSNTLATSSNQQVLQLGTKLSLTNHFHHSFFTQEVDKHKKLLTIKLLKYVLHGKPEEAKEIYSQMPESLFAKVKVAVNDLASGLDDDKVTYREVTLSPFQAALAARDIWLLQNMQPYIHLIPNYQALLKKQIKQQLPNGFSLPPSTYDFNRLAGVILKDAQIGQTGKPSEETLNEIRNFRKHFLPKKCEQGLLFNVNHLIAAHHTYRKHWRGELYANSFYNYRYATVYYSLIIGYLNRLDTTVNAQASCYGLKKLIKSMEALPRNLTLQYCPGMHSDGEIPYFSEKLGVVCGIDASFGIATTAVDCFHTTNNRTQTLLDYHNTVQEKFLELVESFLQEKIPTLTLK